LWFNQQHGGYTPEINPSFELTGVNVSKNLCPRPDDAFYLQVFNTVDVVYQSMFWLGIPIRSEWKLEGMGRSISYDDME